MARCQWMVAGRRQFYGRVIVDDDEAVVDERGQRPLALVRVIPGSGKNVAWHRPVHRPQK